MRRIIVTPAGRRDFLKILYNNLLKYRDQFDEWVLWANTENKKDLAYIEYLATTNDFISCKKLDVKFAGNFSISSFFKYCQDESAVYLRLDDDICFIDSQALNNIFTFRLNNPNPFVVVGNIVNNAVINHIHQKAGRYDTSYGTNSYDALEYLKTDTSSLAVQTHKFFIEKIKSNSITDIYFTDPWIFVNYERVSINAISWFGYDFAAFNGTPDFTGQEDEDEEEFLSCTMPKRLNRPNEVCGTAVFAHFSFNKQLEFLLRNYPEIYTFYLNNSLI